MARPKGVAVWKPSPESAVLLGQVNQVLDEYRDHLPLTVRQVFYRLVGQYGYDKTEHAYKRLGNMLVRARRSLLVPFDSLRDDGTVVREPNGFASTDDFWAAVRSTAERYRRNRQAGQGVFVELACEAGGMVPQMERVARAYSVPVYSGGGFNSLTAIKEVADRALARDVPTVLLHVGDFDPSGVSIFDSLTNDAQMFVRQIVDYAFDGEPKPETLKRLTKVDIRREADLIPVRVVLTDEQVHTYGLDTAPPKGSDTRSVNWSYGYTAQAEALPPDILAVLVRDAIETQLDLGVLGAEKDREDADREAILGRINGS